MPATRIEYLRRECHKLGQGKLGVKKRVVESMIADGEKKKIGRFRAFLLLMSAVALLSIPPRVNATGMLAGRIVGVDTSDRIIPLGWANITVYGNGTVIESLTPAFDGSYSVLLPAGRYGVIVEHNGFITQGKTFEIFNGRQTRLDFRLDLAVSLNSKAFDFSISCGPIVTPVGKSAWTTIQVGLRSGSPQMVSLTILGLPPSTSGALSSSFGSPSFVSTYTIVTSPTTPVGSYTIMLIGMGGGMVHKATFMLTVVAHTYSLDMP